MLSYPSLFLLAASLISTSTAAGCYGVGATGNKNTVINSLRTVCSELQGTYVTQGTRSACVNDGKNHWNLQISNGDEHSATVTLDMCMTNLAASANNCDHGGVTTISNVGYKADPNVGTCLDVGFINASSLKSRVRVKRDGEVYFDSPSANSPKPGVKRDGEVYFNPADTDSIGSS